MNRRRLSWSFRRTAFRRFGRLCCTCGSGAWLYLKKAGTVILAISILLWVLTTFPQSDASISPDQAIRHTVAGRIGVGLEPVLKPMGF